MLLSANLERQVEISVFEQALKHLPPQLSETRAEIERRCPDYQLIADTVNAAKHGRLTKRTPTGSPLVNSAKDISEVLFVTWFEDKDGRYSHAQIAIRIRCVDGTLRDFDNALINVLNFWSDKLSQAGIVHYPRIAPPPVPGTFVPREHAKRINIEALNTTRFQLITQILEYDRAKGRAEPLDLANKILRARIFEPPKYLVDFIATLNDSTEVIVPIELTDEESLALYRMTGDYERETFMQNIFESRQHEILSKLGEIVRANNREQ